MHSDCQKDKGEKTVVVVEFKSRVQSVAITTKVSSNPTHDEVYST